MTLVLDDVYTPTAVALVLDDVSPTTVTLVLDDVSTPTAEGFVLNEVHLPTAMCFVYDECSSMSTAVGLCWMRFTIHFLFVSFLRKRDSLTYSSRFSLKRMSVYAYRSRIVLNKIHLLTLVVFAVVVLKKERFTLLLQ